MAKPDSKQATETLHEIESIFDRMARWATDNPVLLLGIIGGLLVGAASIGGFRAWQADREAELMRREAQSQAERIVEEGQRSMREITRETDALNARRRQFVRAFRTLLERYLADLEVEEARMREEGVDPSRPPSRAPAVESQKVASDSDGEKGDGEWLSTLVGEGEGEEA